MRRFEGQIALVTGGNSTLGSAIVRLFHAEGASVVILGRDESRGHALEDELGSQAQFIAADLASDEQLARCIRAAQVRFGGIDFLVNNAVVYDDRGLESSREEWLDALNVNVVGGAILVRDVLPLMQRRGGGAIVNVASVGGKFGAAGRALYPAAKAAILQLTRNQAMTLAKDRIRVNSVSPGWTWSDPLARLVDGDRELADRVSAAVQPLGRAGDPEEVARAVLFLCSRDASFITGTDLAVDGGFSMLGPDQGRTVGDWIAATRRDGRLGREGTETDLDAMTQWK